MLLMRKPYIGPLISVTIGEERIEWVKHTRILGITFDDMLFWVHHLTFKKQLCQQTEPLEKEFVFVP